MNKPHWREVFEIHFPYIQKLVHVVTRRFRVKSPDSDDVKNIMANLIEEDVLMDISRLAFKKAYLNWDGKRPFKTYYRCVFFNMAKDEIRKQMKHRYRETTLGAFEGEDGKNIQQIDEKVGWIPVEVTDFLDFLNSLTPIQKSVVRAILHSDEMLGMKDGGVKELLGRLKRYTTQVLGLSARSYYETMTEIGMRVHERSKGESVKKWRTKAYVRA